MWECFVEVYSVNVSLLVIFFLVCLFVLVFLCWFEIFDVFLCLFIRFIGCKLIWVEFVFMVVVVCLEYKKRLFWGDLYVLLVRFIILCVRYEYWFFCFLWDWWSKLVVFGNNVKCFFILGFWVFFWSRGFKVKLLCFWILKCEFGWLCFSCVVWFSIFRGFLYLSDWLRFIEFMVVVKWGVGDNLLCFVVRCMLKEMKGIFSLIFFKIIFYIVFK